MANLQLISDLLKKRNLSVTEFCRRASISDQTYRQMRSRNSTKTEILERVAKVLNVPVGYFFGEHTGIVISGEYNQVHSGLGNQIMQTPEQKEIEHLREIIAEKIKIIEEKERMIQLLLSSKSKDVNK